MDFVRRWSEKTEIGAARFIGWLEITASKFCDWRERYDKVNEHNGWVPRDFWLEDWEKQSIIGLHLKNPLEDARRLVQGYVEHYNYGCLNSAVGYITPKGMLAGRRPEIHAE